MKANEKLEKFGEEFIHEVRDYTLSDFNMILSGQIKSEKAQNLHKRIMNLQPEDVLILKEVVANIIDRGLFNIMTFFEQSEDYVVGYMNDDEFIDLNEISDGLGGELLANNGWIKKYSKYD